MTHHKTCELGSVWRAIAATWTLTGTTDPVSLGLSDLVQYLCTLLLGGADRGRLALPCLLLLPSGSERYNLTSRSGPLHE